MNKVAARLRAKARKKEKNPLSFSGMIQFGIWDDELHGHNATSPPDAPRFKNDIGSLVDIIDTACGEDFIVALTKTKEVNRLNKAKEIEKMKSKRIDAFEMLSSY